MTNKIEINHHTYIVPGVVDGAVAMAQAEKRATRDEVTIVHGHAYLDPRSNEHQEAVQPCSWGCKLVTPGNETIELLDYYRGATPPKRQEES